VIRGLVGVALALAGLVPLGRESFPDAPFRVGLAVFTGMAAAMVLLPPLVSSAVAVGASRARAGVVALAAGPCSAAAPGGLRVEPLPLLVLAAPLVLLAARAAKPVDQYDAFANWVLKAKPLLRPQLLDASIAPPCTASIRSVCRRSRLRAARGRQREHAGLARALRRLSRRPRARCVDGAPPARSTWPLQRG
jgi:hypothetical protein